MFHLHRLLFHFGCMWPLFCWHIHMGKNNTFAGYVRVYVYLSTWTASAQIVSNTAGHACDTYMLLDSDQKYF